MAQTFNNNNEMKSYFNKVIEEIKQDVPTWTAPTEVVVPVPAAERGIALEEDLAPLADKYGIPYVWENDIAQALETAKESRPDNGAAVVSGSLYLAGDVLHREVPIEEVLNL